MPPSHFRTRVLAPGHIPWPRTVTLLEVQRALNGPWSSRCVQAIPSSISLPYFCSVKEAAAQYILFSAPTLFHVMHLLTSKTTLCVSSSFFTWCRTYDKATYGSGLKTACFPNPPTSFYLLKITVRFLYSPLAPLLCSFWNYTNRLALKRARHRME